jgi:hypothetical protein
MQTETIIENGQTYKVRIYPDGTKAWYQNGEHHRLDGPSIEWSNGSKEWWIDDTEYSEDEFNQLLKEKANEIKQLRIKEKLTQPENNRFRMLLE